MTAVVGSTFVPRRVTISPSTSTSPASMSSSHLRRLATPDCASSFCSRIRPSSSVSIAVGGYLGGRIRHLADGLLEVHVVHVGHERRQLRELVQRRDADPLEEVARG